VSSVRPVKKPIAATSTTRQAIQYRLAFHDAALVEWQKLDPSVKEPLRKLLKKRLESPRAMNAKLHGDLVDCYKIKLRAQGYRLIYQVIELQLMVLVVSVGKRDKNAVYESAMKRLRQAGVSETRKSKVM
jgi:mRNA interferase RelE/StbE